MMPTDNAVPEAEQPIVVFSGERVAMGPLHTGMIPHIVRWEHDIDTLIIGGDELIVLTPERMKTLFTKLIEEERKDRVFFAIYDRATLEPIGWCNVRDIDLFHEFAELGIAIGNPDFRGRGYGSEAVTLLVDYAFTAFGLRNIMLDTTAYNERAIGAYLKAGFKEIGRRRGSHRIGNRRYDRVFMDCLASEFYKTRTSIFSLPESRLAE
jgi:RimJ/RimL family protein N-acetyltransferase